VAGGPIGDGVQDGEARRGALPYRQSYAISFDGWRPRISCGVNGGSKPSWQGLASGSRPEALQNIGVVRGMGSRLRVGARSSSARIDHLGLRLPLRAYDLLSFFRTLYVFFVVDHASRAVLRVERMRHPTVRSGQADRSSIVECCGWDREPPRFLIHDRDARYDAFFDQRVRSLGITQIRTPFRSPQANAIAERWVRSLRGECLDHVFIFIARRKFANRRAEAFPGKARGTRDGSRLKRVFLHSNYKEITSR
jgi:transposase InsO family protein